MRDLSVVPLGVLEVQPLLRQQREPASEVLLSFGDDGRFLRRFLLFLLLRGLRRLGGLFSVPARFPAAELRPVASLPCRRPRTG
jgi:hypothetical protein